MDERTDEVIVDPTIRGWWVSLDLGQNKYRHTSLDTRHDSVLPGTTSPYSLHGLRRGLRVRSPERPRR